MPGRGSPQWTLDELEGWSGPGTELVKVLPSRRSSRSLPPPCRLILGQGRTPAPSRLGLLQGIHHSPAGWLWAPRVPCTHAHTVPNMYTCHLSLTHTHTHRAPQCVIARVFIYMHTQTLSLSHTQADTQCSQHPHAHTLIRGLSLPLSLSYARARAHTHTHTHTHTHSHSSPRASLGDCEFPQKLPTIDYSCFPLIASWVFVCLGKGAKARGVLNLRVLKARLG